MNINIFSIDESLKWDSIVKSFTNYDIYYLSGYVKAFQIHGDGEPVLVYVEDNNTRAIAVYMKRDVAADNRLLGFGAQRYYDLITPYGYGGLIFEGEINNDVVDNIFRALASYYRSQNIIAEFVRWHPLLQNAKDVRGVIDVIDLGNTIHIDTSSNEVIWANLTSKNRNTIRRAEKSGIIIESTSDLDLYKTFIEIYNKTMDNDNAEPYYYFRQNFYESIVHDLKDNSKLFYAVYDGKIIAMSIILFVNGRVHYHLSGSIYEYRNLNPTNLLLYKVACWAAENGYRTFHLGGGVGSEEDNLFKFKQSFNRNSRNQFSVSKIIHDIDAYNEVVEFRKRIDCEFDCKSTFFPLYRS